MVIKRILIFILLFTPLYTNSFKGEKVGIRNRILVVKSIYKKYYPYAYKSLMLSDPTNVGDASFGKDTFPDYVLLSPSLIHESFHGSFAIKRQKRNDKYFYYGLNDSTEFWVEIFDMPRTLYANNILPNSITGRIPAYPVYILEKMDFQSLQDDSNTSIQKYKFFQLLEEYVCQFHSVKSKISLYNYIQDSIQNKIEKRNAEYYWLTNSLDNYSETYVETMKVLISIYLSYLNENNNDIFLKITNNKSIKEVYTRIENEDKGLRIRLREIRDKIIKDNKDVMGITPQKKLHMKGKFTDIGLNYEYDRFIDSVITISRLKIIDSLLLNSFD